MQTNTLAQSQMAEGDSDVKMASPPDDDLGKKCGLV